MKEPLHFGTQLAPLALPGAHVLDDGSVRFTIISRHAEYIWLLLFDDPKASTPFLEIPLNPEENRLGDVWSIKVPEARAGHFYVYRMAGPQKAPHHYNPRQWLLDPYAQVVCGHETWGNHAPFQKGKHLVHGASFPKGMIIKDDFDWGQDEPLRIPLKDSIVYEAHIRGYTQHKTSGVNHPGTYAGFKEKIPYLQELGVTAVEFLPMFEFNELEYYLDNDARAHLRNYWGYSTRSFFAPMPRFAASTNPGGEVNEFKSLVKALHQAGIEVWLDVVYNHTAEGGQKGPTYSFRGIDNKIFYLHDEQNVYRNYSGCGNSVNSNHPMVSDMIIDSLRYWVTEYHIDGFRFDLATALARGQDGELMKHPPLIEDIDEDPVLRDTKLIAEAWDAAGGYQVGSFPSERWPEWNGRYRDDVRRFWKGDRGMLTAFASALVGSDQVYDRDTQTPLKSLNLITCHDGFTMCDLVSYNQKNNLANGEENRDGENHNHSYNHGIEGPTDNPHILAMRERTMKNLFTTLLMSQGIPMLLAGDEFAQTQHGNNNTYCQDSDQTWLDWSRLEKYTGLQHYVRDLIALRKKLPVLRTPTYLEPSHIEWFGPDDEEVDWENGRCIACKLSQKNEASVYAVYNADERDQTWVLPGNRIGRRWTLALSSAPVKQHGSKITVPAGSSAIFTTMIEQTKK